MAKFSFSEIEEAFLFVSSDMFGMQKAVLCKDSGKILYSSKTVDLDEIEEEEDLDWEQCINMPHKNELDLGQTLVFKFVGLHLPDDYEKVQSFFRRKGAYYRFKNLLDQRGLLQEWFDFQNSQQERALRKWCEWNGIEIED